MNMEVKSAIFNAARDGKLRRLKDLEFLYDTPKLLARGFQVENKVFLDRCSRKEVSLLVSARTNGATPLIIAAKIGHLACVEYLVDQCSADIEQIGSVEFDGETIDGAPPLWCAAAAGHLDVVAFLVVRGANVNATTKTNSTPLRAACFDGHLEIVTYLAQNNADIEVANRHGHTCLMISCYKGHYSIAKHLIEMKAQVNRKSVKGNTALHDCAESGSLDIMKLLLKYNAKMDVDSYGMTPLLAAAVTGHTHIVEYLISRTDLVTVHSKIDALELLGATYVDKKRDMLGALTYWKKAMNARYDGDRLVHPKQAIPPNAAYDGAIEVSTLAALDEIISDPDQMRMQALIVRERILGPAHPDTSYYIRYRGAVYADTGNFNRCVTLWMYALNMQQKILEPLSPMTQSSFVSFAELFSFMMNEAKTKTGRAPVLDFCDMMKVFEKCLKEIDVGITQIKRMGSPAKCSPKVVVSYTSSSGRTDTMSSGLSTSSHYIQSGDRDNTYFHRTLVITLHLICLLNKFGPSLSKKQMLNFKAQVHKLLKLNPRGSNGMTPLHLACSRESSSTVGRFPICNFPNLEVIELLLEVGADPNARDNSRNTPLHTLAISKVCRKEIVDCLLKKGAHLDTINSDGDTFESLRASRGQPLHQVVNSLQHTSLQCLAAKVIRKHRIPYKNELHRYLLPFVHDH